MVLEMKLNLKVSVLVDEYCLNFLELVAPVLVDAGVRYGAAGISIGSLMILSDLYNMTS